MIDVSHINILFKISPACFHLRNIKYVVMLRAQSEFEVMIQCVCTYWK